ncbi:hypothetical protein CVCC1112_1188 [Paenarthrobacter nicotinovorans]|nr:hypothetical protein CVCC1112_1188 [Paenarthrobacter nicotinovorans]
MGMGHLLGSSLGFAPLHAAMQLDLRAANPGRIARASLLPGPLCA